MRLYLLQGYYCPHCWARFSERGSNKVRYRGYLRSALTIYPHNSEIAGEIADLLLDGIEYKIICDHCGKQIEKNDIKIIGE